MLPCPVRERQGFILKLAQRAYLAVDTNDDMGSQVALLVDGEHQRT
jgi:hypothetical protein